VINQTQWHRLQSHHLLQFNTQTLVTKGCGGLYSVKFQVNNDQIKIITDFTEVWMIDNQKYRFTANGSVYQAGTCGKKAIYTEFNICFIQIISTSSIDKRIL
jgi:hypothetical protein